MAEFTLRGVDDLMRRITSISGNAREELGTATLEEAEAIAQRSRDEFVPIAEGRLRDTIHVVKGQVSQGRNVIGQFTSGSAVEVAITAGDESTPHALAVHEHPSEHDPPSWQGVTVNFNPPGHGPKFLERPLNDAIHGMAARVADKVGSKLG